ncbi:pac motif [Lucifera butyrica]|uniref:Pac motif n=1 Tax=Lucifera butyrica TaxID=1351585 RepID=A0A498REW8_9FIRM|nr:GGDEF domain-containing protein [Lucifera butyrica]VBB09487.1 pac motif [Lucifera butyrica]
MKKLFAGFETRKPQNLEILKIVQSMLDTMPNPIFYKDSSGSYQFCNKAFAEFLGIDKKEIIGKTVYNISPQKFAEKYHEMDTALFTDPKVQVYEYQVKNKSGEIRDVIFNKAPYFDLNGQVAGLVGVIVDITDRKKLESARQASEAKYRALFNHLNNGFIYFRGLEDEAGAIIDYQVMDVNSSLEKLTGLNHDELVGVKISESIFKPENTELNWIQFMNRICSSRTRETFEYYSALFHKWFEISAYSPQTNCCALVFADITEQKSNIEKARYYAYHDSLTSLPNRRLFEDRLSLAIDQAKHNREKIAVIYLDLDNFKNVNDTFGHEGGDILLKEVADRLLSCVREGDTVSRLGGDEFVLILPNLKTNDDAIKVASRILEESRRPFCINSHTVKISASIGISLFPEDGDDITSLMRNSDAAMYLGKKQGRNRICYLNECIK